MGNIETNSCMGQVKETKQRNKDFAGADIVNCNHTKTGGDCNCEVI